MIIADILPGRAQQKQSSQTGAVIYWQNAEDSAAQIEADLIVMDRMADILSK